MGQIASLLRHDYVSYVVSISGLVETKGVTEVVVDIPLGVSVNWSTILLQCKLLELMLMKSILLLLTWLRVKLIVCLAYVLDQL